MNNTIRRAFNIALINNAGQGVGQRPIVKQTGFTRRQKSKLAMIANLERKIIFN